MFIRQWVAGALILLSMATVAQHQPYQDIQLKQFPDLQPRTLSSIDNKKPTYLKFWASWCKPCMEQMPHFEKTYQKYRDELNVIAVNINMNEEAARIEEVIKRFDLHMPVWLDNEGALGVALGLIGTPYSVLINPEGKVLYTTHESDAALDVRLAMLAEGKSGENGITAEPVSREQKKKLLEPWAQGEHLIFFTATWCDWYLADTRPEMAQQCKSAQSDLNTLHKRLPDMPWHGVANHLWTDEQALKEFTQKYNLRIDFSIDTFGVLFNSFKVRDIPTLVWIKDGKIVKRITDFENMDAVVDQLQATVKNNGES